jgi:hypothetical protein
MLLRYSLTHILILFQFSQQSRWFLLVHRIDLLISYTIFSSFLNHTSKFSNMFNPWHWDWALCGTTFLCLGVYHGTLHWEMRHQNIFVCITWSFLRASLSQNSPFLALKCLWLLVYLLVFPPQMHVHTLGWPHHRDAGDNSQADEHTLLSIPSHWPASSTDSQERVTPH